MLKLKLVPNHRQHSKQAKYRNPPSHPYPIEGMNSDQDVHLIYVKRALWYLEQAREFNKVGNRSEYARYLAEYTYLQRVTIPDWEKYMEGKRK